MCTCGLLDRAVLSQDRGVLAVARLYSFQRSIEHRSHRREASMRLHLGQRGGSMAKKKNSCLRRAFQRTIERKHNIGRSENRETLFKSTQAELNNAELFEMHTGRSAYFETLVISIQAEVTNLAYQIRTGSDGKMRISCRIYSGRAGKC